MAPPIPIPADIRAWLLDVFGSCNERVAGLVTEVPTTHETPLDMTFIQHFLGVSAPHRFESGWTVDLSTHFLGGGRHWADWPEWPRRWEIADIGLLVLFRQAGKIADIGLLVLFRQAGKLIRSKVALLQSKRLYPDELDWDEETPLDYMKGFGRLFQPDEDWANVTAPRQFNFSEHSRYRALVTGLGQYKAITEYEKRNSIPVYYLLYNPTHIPSTVVLPISSQVRIPHSCEVGCRVVPAAQLRAAIGGKPEGSSPAYGDLSNSLPAPFDNRAHRSGWRLEHFVVNLLLECDVGYIANSPSDGGLNYIFNRRTGPISAALALTLDAP